MKSMLAPTNERPGEAKDNAAGRQTAVKALFEHALRKGIGLEKRKTSSRGSSASADEQARPAPGAGKRAKTVVSSKLIYEMMDKLGI